MSPPRCALVLGVVLVWAAVLVSSAAEVPPGDARPPRPITTGPYNLVGLLNRGEVQKELGLSEEQVRKWKEGIGEVAKQAQEGLALWRTITGARERRTKRDELLKQLREKQRSLVQAILSKKQLERLNQVRVQRLGAVYALSDPWVTTRLPLTDGQKQKLSEIQKAIEQKTTKLREPLRNLNNLSQEERDKKVAAFGKELRSILDKASEEALGLLTAEQKAELGKIQGKKFELQPRRSRE